MNRREALASALFAPLAAASAAASVEKEKPSITATRLDPNCPVEVRVSGYPDGDFAAERERFNNYANPGTLFVIDEKPLDPEMKEALEHVWRQHRQFTGEPPKIVPGWTFTSIPSE